MVDGKLQMLLSESYHLELKVIYFSLFRLFLDLIQTLNIKLILLVNIMTIAMNVLKMK